MKKLNIEISNLTEAQAIAIEDMFATWVKLSNIGGSRWASFYVDGDGNFHPEILINGEKPQIAPIDIISPIERDEMWKNNEYRIDYDKIAQKINS